MQSASYAIGQAVFIRTDTPDYAEVAVPFKTLEEMVRICTTPQENMILDKIMAYSLVDGAPQAVMLAFMSSCNGPHPGTAAVEAQ
jgi:hypothetical protein